MVFKPDVIFTHADVDGLCSASILLSKFPRTKVFFTKPVSLLRDIKMERKKRIAICDIAFNKKDTDEILKEFSRRDVIYFDHHPITDINLQEGVHTNSKKSTSEMVFSHYKKDIPDEMVLPALYGAIADYRITPFVKKELRNWDARTIYFEMSVLVLGIKNEEFTKYGRKREIVEWLSKSMKPSSFPGLAASAKEASRREFELYKIVKENVKIGANLAYYFYERYFGFRGPSALFAAATGNRPLGLSAFMRGEHIDITLRSRKDMPLNILAEQAASFVNGSGGGHPDAAGCRIPSGSFEEFIKKLDELAGKHYNPPH